MEEVKKLKKVRNTKHNQFKRRNSVVISLIDGSGTLDSLTDPMKDLEEAFAALEAAHDEYSAAADDKDIEEEGDFMESPLALYTQAKLKLNQKAEAISSKEAKQKLDSRMVSFKANLDNFNKSAEYVLQLIESNAASATDIRVELSMLDTKYSEVLKEKNEVLSGGIIADSAEVTKQFEDLVITPREKCKTAAYKFLKDSPAPVAPVVNGGGSRTSSSSMSTTKRETVMLPKFSGDEKTAFLKYPIWKTQWDSHILEYEEKYRATMLQNHLDDKAMAQIVGYENDYEGAITQLDNYYSDSNKLIKACLDEIRSHGQVNQFDYKGLVAYKKCLVNNHARLKAAKLEHEMSNTAAISVLVRKLPIQEVVEWKKYLAKKDKAEQCKPFPAFMQWLEEAGASWELLAASNTGVKQKSGSMSVHHTFYGDELDEEKSASKKGCFKCGQEGHLKRDCPNKGPRKGTGSTDGGKSGARQDRKPRPAPKHKKFHCAFHKEAKDKFCSTWSCPALKYVAFGERIKLLRANGDCELCCGDCPKNNCQAKSQRICGGNKEGRGCGNNHVGHELYCQSAKLCFKTQVETVFESFEDKEDAVMLQVMKIPSLDNSSEYESVLWDSACSGLFVRDEHARKMGFACQQKRLRVITLGGDVKEIDGVLYQCEIKDLDGNRYQFLAHGLEQVTGFLETNLSKELMRKLFPGIIGGYKMCGAKQVDYLIGLAKASWQPERTVQATGGGDLWVWKNRFGSCIGGSHPLVGNSVTRSDNIYTVLKVVQMDSVEENSLRIPTCSAFAVKTSPMDAADFFRSEQLGTVIEPKCGSCRCGRCPVPGSRYSFREESELKLIQDNLRYDDANSCWIAAYPYLHPRETLKGSKAVALKALNAIEKTLLKNKEWSVVYDEQIEDMVKRGAARVVPEEELAKYKGHINYLPHLAAVNPKSQSTPVRICFDASRVQGGGPSLNQILAKGPDRFLNNLAGVIVGFRNGRVAAKGDVRKMYNCVKLETDDTFVQCFLWRNLDQSKEPATYQVTVNNIGIKPAGAIATLALQNSCEKFKDAYPVTAEQLVKKSYVDDLGVTAQGKDELLARTQEADEILKHAGMAVKKWICSGSDEELVLVGESSDATLADNGEVERMLGVLWDSGLDVFKFTVRINLSPLKKKSRLGPDLSRKDLLENPPEVITRRQFYSQIQSLFDPLGLLAPLILKAKILLRKTWEEECQKLHWDDALPAGLVSEMVDFFAGLFDLEAITFNRSLWPSQENVLGSPELVIFSDGSKLAFGAVAYLRWQIAEGNWYVTLVMAKSKIAPRNLLTIPRLELNGAVLSKRLEEFLVAHIDLSLGNVYHLVDSSTVLGYVHKPDSRLKPFEGVRVSEIQTAGKFQDGRLQNWAWVEGHNNPADWATKPRTAKELEAEGFWQKGPVFLTKDYEHWPVRLDFKKETLEGEIKPKGVHLVFVSSDTMGNTFYELLSRTNDVKKLFRIVEFLFKWKGLQQSEEYSGNVHEKARNFWIKFSQQEIYSELEKSVVIEAENKEKVHGKYKRLAPFLGQDGIWRVGSRMREFVPFTRDHQAPALLPFNSKLSELLMIEAHERKHSGINETVAQFRMSGYWVPQAMKLAKSIKHKCIICRYLDRIPMQQSMGSFPKDLQSCPSAWSHVELDLFGPFVCKSDTNKRSTIKVWGAVLIDQNSGAVYLDIMLDYSSQEVVKMLRRFGSLYGWPMRISSDPGSQLESSSGHLEAWWQMLGDQLTEYASKSKFQWCISPANSPWRQGRSESRIRVVKRLLKISVGCVKLSPVELQTAMFEVASLCNDRPIGINKTPKEDGSFDVLTPNCLLMGRAINRVPDDAKLVQNLKHSERYALIQQATTDFWKRWAVEVTPESVIRQKWHEDGRNLAIGDVVLVHDSSPIKGKYTLAIVQDVRLSRDNRVRSCTVGYRVPNPKDKVREYTGGKWIKLSRSVQKLSLLLPVEEQVIKLEVKDNVLKAVSKQQESD